MPAAFNRHRAPPPSYSSRQQGIGAAGFLLTALPVLMLGMGGVEMAYWLNLRQTLSLALMDTARVGATHHAEPQAMARAFEHGLRMAYPQPSAAEKALWQRRRDLGTPWHIHILQPSPAAFLDHADPALRLKGHTDRPMIRNDYQELAHARRLAQGWRDGRGPQSGLTIHAANTLEMELRWPHRPTLPGIATLIRWLSPMAADAIQRRWMRHGYLPFRRRVSVAMQSHPAAWPPLADGRIAYGAPAVLPTTRPSSIPHWPTDNRPAAPTDTGHKGNASIGLEPIDQGSAASPGTPPAEPPDAPSPTPASPIESPSSPNQPADLQDDTGTWPACDPLK